MPLDFNQQNPSEGFCPKNKESNKEMKSLARE